MSEHIILWLTEPLHYGFFTRGLIAGVITALACGILSSFVVWRGMSFIGDALSHAVLPGIVISVILGINILVGALIAAFISVLGIGALSGTKGFKEDTSIGVIFTGAFALGIMLMSKVSSFQDLSHILFGNILGIKSEDLYIIGITGIIVLVTVILFFKELLVTSFDEIHATSIGLSPKLIQYGLLFLIAGTTVISSQAVGVVMVLALLITPAATASLLSKNIQRISVLSVILSMFSVVTGFYCSYYFDLASGATIVLILTSAFVVAFLYSKVRNLK